MNHECNLCEYLGSSLNDLNEHSAIKHLTMCSCCVNMIQVAKVKRGQIFKCELCKQFVDRAKTNSVVVKNLSNQIVKNYFLCMECKFAASNAYDLIIHKEIEHTHPCDHCEFTATTDKHLRYHKGVNHAEKRFYICVLCDYSTTCSSNLKVHMNGVHGGIRYPCDQCDYSAKTSDTLKTHKKSIHKGIRYQCDKCDYAATRHGNLKVHKNGVH